MAAKGRQVDYDDLSAAARAARVASLLMRIADGAEEHFVADARRAQSSLTRLAAGGLAVTLVVHGGVHCLLPFLIRLEYTAAALGAS